MNNAAAATAVVDESNGGTSTSPEVLASPARIGTNACDTTADHRACSPCTGITHAAAADASTDIEIDTRAASAPSPDPEPAVTSSLSRGHRFQSTATYAISSSDF